MNHIMRRPKNISFRTDKKSDRASLRRLTLIVAAGAAFVLLASCLVILSKNDFNVKSAVGVNIETESSTAAEKTEIKVAESDKLYFLWCASSDKKTTRFAWLVRVRMPERAVGICPVSPATAVELDGGESLTLNDIFARYGEKRLLEAVEDYTGRQVDRYVASTDESFKSMINYFGGVTVNVPDQIEYRGDFTLILVKGKQNMKGDTLFKYLRYLGLLGDADAQEQVLADILGSVFKPQNAGRLSNIFSKFSNTLNTNVTIVDFSQAENGIRAILDGGMEITAAESCEELLNQKYKRK